MGYMWLSKDGYGATQMLITCGKVSATLGGKSGASGGIARRVPGLPGLRAAGSQAGIEAVQREPLRFLQRRATWWVITLCQGAGTRRIRGVVHAGTLKSVAARQALTPIYLQQILDHYMRNTRCKWIECEAMVLPIDPTRLFELLSKPRSSLGLPLLGTLPRSGFREGGRVSAFFGIT